MPAIVIVVCIAFFQLYSAEASAIIMFNVTPDPLTRSVMENDIGAFNFTVKNLGTEDITIKTIVTGDRFGFRDPLFIEGDRHDEVSRHQLGNLGNCIDKTLGPSGTCVFQDVFFTRDLHPELSGSNFGKWLISNIVTLRNFPAFGTQEVGSAKVVVFDAPEPSSWLLFVPGLIGISLWRKSYSGRV
jgi:hypothetical protein